MAEKGGIMICLRPWLIQSGWEQSTETHPPKITEIPMKEKMALLDGWNNCLSNAKP